MTWSLPRQAVACTGRGRDHGLSSTRCAPRSVGILLRSRRGQRVPGAGASVDILPAACRPSRGAGCPVRGVGCWPCWQRPGSRSAASSWLARRSRSLSRRSCSNRLIPTACCTVSVAWPVDRCRVSSAAMSESGGGKWRRKVVLASPSRRASANTVAGLPRPAGALAHFSHSGADLLDAGQSGAAAHGISGLWRSRNLSMWSR